jgi:hypothetical protein
MSGISAAARRELVESVGARYHSATVDDKRRMLDEFVAVTEYHRKHAIRILILWFVGDFVVAFELLGLPVRNNTYGWLGPTPRSSACVEDIGKINYWTCKDIFAFTRRRVGCLLWLRLNGFDAGE